MYHNVLDEFANWSMVLNAEQVALGLRGILAAARADSSISSADVASELFSMFGRNESLEEVDIAVRREVEDWVVKNWREDSPEFIDAIGGVVLTGGMTRGFLLLEKAVHSSNERVRAIAQETLDEAARDRVNGWETDT
jgi:hypothetical protein